MKTVLSNAKKYLSILLAAAMVILSIPNAPVTLLAATVDETATEATDTTENVDAEEVVKGTDAEEAAPETEAAPEAEEEVIADEAAAGSESAEDEEIAEDSFERPDPVTGNFGLFPRSYSDYAEDPDSESMYSGSDVATNTIYIAKGHKAWLRLGDKGDNYDTTSTKITKVITSGSADAATLTIDPTGNRILIDAKKAGKVNVDGISTNGEGAEPFNGIQEQGNKPKIVVVDMTASIGGEALTSEDTPTLVLDTATGNGMVPPIAESIEYSIVDGTGTNTSVTWNLTAGGYWWDEAKSELKTVTAQDIVSPNSISQPLVFNDDGEEYWVVDSADQEKKVTITPYQMGGFVKVVAEYNPAAGVDFILDDEFLIDNKTAQVEVNGGKKGVEPEFVTQNGEFYTAYGAVTRVEKLDKNSSYVYELTPLTQSGAPLDIAEEGIRFQIEEDDFPGIVNDSVKVSNAGVLTFDTEKQAKTETGSITVKVSAPFALNNEEQETLRVVGNITLDYEIQDTDELKIMYLSDDYDEMTAVTSNYSILSALENPSDNGDAVNGAYINLGVTGNKAGSFVSWNADELKEYGLFASVTENLTPGSDGMLGMQVTYNDNAENHDYGLFNAEAWVTSNEEATKVTYPIYVFDLTEDGEHRLGDNVAAYTMTLNIQAKDKNVSVNETTGQPYTSRFWFDKTFDQTASGNVSTGDLISYQKSNLKYSETKAIDVLDGGMDGVVSIEMKSLDTVSGYYVDPNAQDPYIGKGEARLIDYRVIDIDGQNIIARAPGRATVNVTYTFTNANGDVVTWTRPVVVEVKDVDAVDVESQVTDPKTGIIVDGGSAKIESYASANSALLQGVDFAYEVTEVTNNGTRLSAAQLESAKELFTDNGDGSVTVASTEAFTITQNMEFGVRTSITGNSVYKGEESDDLFELTVVPVAAATVTANETTVDLGVGDFENVTLHNAGGLTVATKAEDEKIAVARVSENDGFYDSTWIEGMSTGTTTVPVTVKDLGATDEITVNVYGLSGSENLTYDEKNNCYQLVMEKVDNKWQNEELCMILGESVQDLSNAPISTDVAGLRGTTIDGKIATLSYTGTVALKDEPVVVNGKNGQSVLVRVSTLDRTYKAVFTDTGVSTNEGYTDKVITAISDEDDFIIMPKVTVSEDGKETELVPGKDYQVTWNLTNAQKDLFTMDLMDDGKEVVVSPKDLFDEEQVTIQAKADNGKVLAQATANISTWAPTVFVDEDTVLDAYATAADALSNGATDEIYSFTNYAKVGSTPVTAPTLDNAIDYMGDAKEFWVGEGWTFKKANDKLTSILGDADEDGNIVVEAVYEIAGETITSNLIPAHIGTIKGLFIEGTNDDGGNDDIQATIAGVYTQYDAKFHTGENHFITVEPVVEEEKSPSVNKRTLDPGYTDLFALSSDLTATITTGKDFLTVDTLKKGSGFSLITNQKPGSANVSIKDHGFEALLTSKIADEDRFATLNFTTANTYETTPTGDPFGNEANVKALDNDKYMLDFDDSDDSITLFVQVDGKQTLTNFMDEDDDEPVVKIKSSDTSVATVKDAFMTPGAKFGDATVSGQVFSSKITPVGPGLTTLTVEATDDVKTTITVDLFVVSAGAPKAGTEEGNAVEISNIDKDASAAVYFAFDDDYFESSDVTENGYTVTGNIEITNEDYDEIFKIEPSVDPGIYTLTLQKDYQPGGKKELAPGDYTLMLKGTSNLNYFDESGDLAQTKPAKFNNVSLPVKVISATKINVNPTVLTVTQGDTKPLDCTIYPDNVVWSDVTYELADPDAAAKLGIGLSSDGLSVIVDRNAEVGKKTFDVYVNAVNAEGTPGRSEATEFTVEVVARESDSVLVNGGQIEITQGSTATLTAVWADGIARTNTFALQGTYEGFSLNGNVLSATTAATSRDIVLKVTGAGEIPAEATVTVPVLVSPFDYTLTLDNKDKLSIGLGQTKKLTAKAVSTTGDLTISNYRFDSLSGSVVNGKLALSTDGTLTAVDNEEYVGTYSDLVILVDLEDKLGNKVEGASITGVNITVNNNGGGNHDVDDNPTTENELEDITNEKFKAYQVESSFDITKKDATTTVYFVGNVNPDEVTLPESSPFTIVNTIVGSGYTKAVIALKDQTWDSAQSTAKNGKKVAFTLGKDGKTCVNQATLTLKLSAAAPKISLTVKKGTAYPVEDAFWGQWFVDDKNGNLAGSDVIYVENKDSKTAVEDVNVTEGTQIILSGTKEYKKGGLYVTNDNWVDGLGVFASFPISMAKATAQPVIKLGKKNATLKNEVGQIFKTPVTVGGLTLGDGELVVTGAPENVNAVIEGGYLQISTEEGVAAGTYTLTVNTALDVPIQAKKAESFKLTVTDKDAKVSYSVKGKLDSIADDTAVYVTPKLTNASGEIEVAPETQADLEELKLKATVDNGIIKIEKDPAAFAGASVQYIEKGNKVINNFKILVGENTAVSAKLSIPVVQGKLTATGTAIDFRNKLGAEYGTSSIQAVYTYSVYNQAGKVAVKKYYTFTNEAVKLTDPKAGKLSVNTTDDGQVKVTNPSDGKDYNGTVKVTVNGTTIKAVTAKFKVLGKTK